MPLTIVEVAEDVDRELRGAVVAVSDFDGVHKGHQGLIAAAAQSARRLGAPLAAASVRFHPAFERLTSPDQQARLLESLGVEILYVIGADRREADGAAARWAELLARRLGAREAVIDSKEAREFAWLSAMAHLASNDGANVSLVEQAAAVSMRPVSAEAARAALRAGRPDLASDILGRPFALAGIVVEGQKLGRRLGYPTANVDAAEYVRPRLGVYATRSRLPDGREMPGVANFGVNPTTGLVDARLEVWLFDFDEDIYGQTLETDFIAFLRPELRFDGLEALVSQIARDVEEARQMLFGAAAVERMTG
jgi:riboflavin kinase/FMN adenylyltransferase